MNNACLPFNCEWYCYKSYQIKNGKIMPTKESKNDETIFYNPFDYYRIENDFRQKLNDRPSINDLQIHWSFASIKSEQSVFEWVSKYGMPYSIYGKDNSESNNEANRDFPLFPDANISILKKNALNVKDIQKEAETFRNTIDLYNALKNNESETIWETFVRSYLRNIWRPLFYRNTDLNSSVINAVPLNMPIPNKEPLTEDEVIDTAAKDSFLIANEYLTALISYSTQSINETIKFTKTGFPSFAVISYSCSSILALLYRMLLIDWSKGYSVRHCADPKCNTYFIPSNDKNVFCSSLCKNRVKVEKFRGKK